VLLLLIGYWGGVWLRSRPKVAPKPLLPRLSGALAAAAGGGGAHWAARRAGSIQPRCCIAPAARWPR
jgi:hypothetical protein